MVKAKIDEYDDKSIPLDPNLLNSTHTSKEQQGQQPQPHQTQQEPVSHQPFNDDSVDNTHLLNDGNSSSNSNQKNISEHSTSNLTNLSLAEEQQRKAEMMADEDPLLISQTLTYVTDDGGVLHSFQSAPFSFGFKFQFFLLEVIFIVLMIAAVPIGAHGTVVGVCVANLLLLAWFWYNLVRSVDITADGTLRFWIGNIEVDIPFDKIITIKRVATSMPCCSSCALGVSFTQYRGFLATPTDGAAIITSLPSTPFWLWPRSAGKPDRSCFFGLLSCPRLTIVFSPAGGSMNFIREVENEMRNFATSGSKAPTSIGNRGTTAVPRAANQDYLDV